MLMAHASLGKTTRICLEQVWDFSRSGSFSLGIFFFFFGKGYIRHQAFWGNKVYGRKGQLPTEPLNHRRRTSRIFLCLIYAH